MSVETLIRDTAKEIMELRHDAMKGLVEARNLNLNGAKKASKIIDRGARLTLALSCPHNEVKGVKGFKEAFPELQLHALTTCLSAHLWAVAVLKGCRLSFWDWEADEYPDLNEKEPQCQH